MLAYVVILLLRSSNSRGDSLGRILVVSISPANYLVLLRVSRPR